MELPQCLYKYRSLATNENINRARDILVNNRVYFASAASFNDPFEGQATISFDSSATNKLNVLKRYAMETHGLELSRASEWASRAFQNNIAEPEAHIHDELRAAFRKGAGLCTFSEKNDDILMWAHYADSHGGICIEFTSRKSDQIKWFEGGVPVKYQPDFPVVNYYERNTVEKNAIAAMATKSSHWSYEKEWRLLRSKPGLYDLPKGVISAVITGCAISDENRALVHEWVVACSPSVSLHETSIKPGEYALEIV
jgi:hypothetical protein